MYLLYIYNINTVYISNYSICHLGNEMLYVFRGSKFARSSRLQASQKWNLATVMWHEVCRTMNETCVRNLGTCALESCGNSLWIMRAFGLILFSLRSFTGRKIASSRHQNRDFYRILLMDKILHHQGWWLSHYLWGFNHPRWCRILSINSIIARHDINVLHFVLDFQLQIHLQHRARPESNPCGKAQGVNMG